MGGIAREPLVGEVGIVLDLPDGFHDVDVVRDAPVLEVGRSPRLQDLTRDEDRLRPVQVDARPEHFEGHRSAGHGVNGIGPTGPRLWMWAYRCDMTYVIALPCVDVKDRACVDECPVDCIYEGERMLYIHPDECVDCGACEPVCPVEAIFFEDDLPEEWADFLPANAGFFEGIGSPGGAARVGPIAKDDPLIEELPPQG